MEKFNTTLRQSFTMEEIEAIERCAAEEAAYDRWFDGLTKFSDSGIPRDTGISPEKVPESETGKGTIQIFWDDLTKSKQDEI